MKRRLPIVPLGLGAAILVLVGFVVSLFTGVQLLVTLMAIPALFLVPGLLLFACLYPELWSPGHRRSWAAQRFADQGPGFPALFGIGLSVTLIGLMGLALNYLFAIDRVKVLATVIVVDLLLAAIALGRWVRIRDHTPEKDAAARAPAMPVPTLSLRNPVHVVGLLAVAALTLGIAAAALTEPPRAEFTEFYVVGPTDNAICLPDRFDGNFTSTDPRCRIDLGRLTLGLVNQEGRPITYAAVVEWNVEGATRVASSSPHQVAVWIVATESKDDPVYDERGEAPQHEQVVFLKPPTQTGWNALSVRLFELPGTVTEVDEIDGSTLADPMRELRLWVFAEAV